MVQPEGVRQSLHSSALHLGLGKQAGHRQAGRPPLFFSSEIAMECRASIAIPFPSARLAETALRVLEVDGQPDPSRCTRVLKADGNTLLA